MTYNGKVQKPSIKTIAGKSLKSGTDYLVTWSNESSRNAGTYTVTIAGQGNYVGIAQAKYNINKAKNTMTLKAKKSVKIKNKKLKKKAVKFNISNALAIKNAKGKLSYKLVSVKKDRKSFKKNFSINVKKGKVNIKKKTPKGTYKVKVKVKAKGNGNYKASTWKEVTFKVIVK